MGQASTVHCLLAVAWEDMHIYFHMPCVVPCPIASLRDSATSGTGGLMKVHFLYIAYYTPRLIHISYAFEV